MIPILNVTFVGVGRIFPWAICVGAQDLGFATSSRSRGYLIPRLLSWESDEWKEERALNHNDLGRPGPI